MTLSRYVVVLFGLLFASGGLIAVFPDTTHSATELRPNLQPQSASELRISYEAGQKLLRFTTLGWNSGAGPLEVVPGDVDPGTGKQKVYQRVYDDSGSYTDYIAGFMDWHQAHNHFHFNDYARYTLRPATSNGQSERYGAKLTFCLMDTNRIDHRLPGAPKRAQYTTCGLDRQGISVGWGDAYRYYLAGQSIDVTGLPDGEYDLFITLDPQGKIIETSDDDNTSVTRVRITGDVVEVLGGGKPGNGNGRPPR